MLRHAGRQLSSLRRIYCVIDTMSATAAREPQPSMEYTVECTGNRAGIEAWLPAEVEMLFN